VPGSSGDRTDCAPALGMPLSGRKDTQCGVVVPREKFQNGLLQRVLGTTEEAHVHKPREGRSQRRLLGVGSHWSRSRKYPKA